MIDGVKLRYDKVQKVKSNAIEFNSIALALPAYRSLVSSTTSALIPHLFQYIEHEESKTGRPGTNRIGIPYISAVGVEKCMAIAVVTTVNNFHRSLSHQSLSSKIGQYISTEWGILQEDPAVVSRVISNTFKGASAMRRQRFLRQQLQNILGRPLLSVPQVGKIAIGNILLSLIERTPLVSLTRDNKKGFIISASNEVLSSLDHQLRVGAESNPVSLPSLTPQETDASLILKPQAGRDSSLSTTDEGSIFHKACTTLDETGYAVCQDQLNFIIELSNCPTTTLGIPGHKQLELPPYQDDMSDEQKQAVRMARAKVYATRNVWKGKRAKLLSSLSLLKQYKCKELFFNVQADFRGRLYPEADLLSYQGEDWLRSVWQFSKGKPITQQDQADWLYIHAANCYGLSRKPYADRISYITSRLDEFRLLVYDPFHYASMLEEAAHPFRFLAAIREVVNFENGGFGYVSHIPVQIDASSQAIQIWAGLTNNRELLKDSNVICDNDGKSMPCNDIYKNLADDIFADAMNDSDSGAMHWRLGGIDRSTVKKAMMIIPYGGTYTAVQRIVDQGNTDAPLSARVWLTSKLWNDSRDILHDLVKMQERLSQAVSAYMRETDGTTYEWTSPCGVHVKQRYMKNKKKRIKNAVGQTLYSYNLETDTVDKKKHAAAFPANFLHSLDASLLCYFISLMSEYGFKQIMPIHDCVGIPAADVHASKYFLGVSYLWTILEGQRLAKGQCNILKVGIDCPEPWYPQVNGLPETPWVLSPYLFS